MRRNTQEYADWAELSLEEANGMANDASPGAAFNVEQLRVEARVWAALAIAASNLESARR
jgi:hypothetical protein